MSGSLSAPSLSSHILNTLTFSAAVLFRGSLTFFMPPLTRGPFLTHLRMFALPHNLLGQCPPSPGPLSLGGAAAIRTRHGRLFTASRHLLPSEALCTSGAASGSSLPTALARSAPTAGVDARMGLPSLTLKSGTP